MSPVSDLLITNQREPEIRGDRAPSRVCFFEDLCFGVIELIRA
jgi:hypothetical protein